MKKITVFTPTYNRAYILPKLYDSLCSQTCDDFEWVIVDDGSTDDTEDIVDKWIKDNKIEIHYYKQENGGKQRAHNTGVEKSNGILFVCEDSDDYVKSNFIELHQKYMEAIKDDESVAGIISLQGHEDGKPMGTLFPDGLDITRLGKLYGKLGFKGDATIAHYTSILKEYPFYVAPGEKFIGEGYVYYQIDQKYSLKVLPEILLIKEYLNDGYTKNVRRLTKDNPKSYVVLKRQSVELADSLMEKYKQTILYMVGCRLSGQKMIKNAPNKVLAVLAYFPSWLAWMIFYKRA